MSKTKKSASSFSSRYDKSRLFVGSYGSVFYLPKVDLLSQLSLSTHSLMQSVGVTGTEDSLADGTDFFAHKIKVPVPPLPSVAMINPDTKERFPLGTRVDPGTGVSLEEVESVLEERSIVNQIIYTDPDNGTVYYVNKSGSIAAHNIGHVSKIVENTNEILQMLECKLPVKPSFRRGESGLRHKWDSSAAEGLFYVDPKDASPRAKAHRTRLQSMSGVSFDKRGEGVPFFMYATNRDFKEFVESELLSIEKKISQGKASVPSQQMGIRYAQLIVATLFAEDHRSLFSDLISQEEKVSSVSADDAPSIPHVKDDTRFLPHQAYALSFLKDKKAAMVDADPGAGKTLIMLSDILDKLGRGIVRRPCIVMPNPLLSQQKREMREWTRGTVNFYVINTDTCKQADPDSLSSATGLPKKTGGNQNKGLQQIKKELQEAPPNTIILTSYKWLRGRPEDQRQTGSGVHFKRPSWLTTWAGVDMLVLDESHNIRVGSSGDQSKQSQAIMQMARLVPYKRCYTGTVAPNGPDDIFLQINFLDPSVFGDRKLFKNKYGLSAEEGGKGRGKRIEKFKPGAIKEIRSVVSRRVGVSIRRSAWLNLLPQLDVNYHKAELTVPQRHVYARIMDRILREELGEDDHGTAGLQLQQEFRDKYASDPVARAKVSEWKAPSTVVPVDIEGSVEDRLAMEYELGNQDTEDDLKAARKRARDGWEQYQYIEDAVKENDFLPLIQKFVALDMFLNNPPSDDFGKHFLFHDEDRISPKVKVIDSLLSSHFANPANGKVIIFTQYKSVAGHIMEHMQMSSSAIYYDASHSKNLDLFKTDDSVKIIVAVEQSIVEGQNLQMANRIIRVDLPWNPGTYQQAISRAYRLPPKDPDAERYSVVHVDLILTEGTAEITKFMRMVSKMHKVRQLVSGFVAEREFPLVGMNLQNMREMNTFAKMSVHQDAYTRMRDQEIEEAKTAPDLFGTDIHEIATGDKISGSETLETPYVRSDTDQNPWITDPSNYDESVLVNPGVIYFNGSFYMSIVLNPRMEKILEGFKIEKRPQFMYKTFGTARAGFDIIKALQSNPEVPLHVINANELIPKIMGRVPVDPSVPESVIDYSGLMKMAAAPPPDFRSTNPSYADDILAYQPSQKDFIAASSMLKLAAGGKPITALHSLSAAKLFGYFDLDTSSVDPTWLWKNSRYFSLLRKNKSILQQQLLKTPPQGELTQPAAAANLKNEVTQEPQDNSIPGLDTDVTSEGVPVQLNISILGKINQSSVQQYPCFTLSDTSGFTSPGFANRVVSILEAHGFKAWKSEQQWVYMGSSRASAAAGIRKFTNRLYRYSYYLVDRDKFEASISKFGLSLSSVWPKSSLHAVKRMASLLENYPEYSELTNKVYSDE